MNEDTQKTTTPASVGGAVPAKGSLADKLKDAQSAIGAAAGFTQGAQGTQSASPARSIVRPAPVPTRPTKLAAGEVLFASAKPNLGAQYQTKILKFKEGYYVTSDKGEIAYLRENAAHFQLSEQKV